MASWCLHLGAWYRSVVCLGRHWQICDMLLVVKEYIQGISEKTYVLDVPDFSNTVRLLLSPTDPVDASERMFVIVRSRCL